MGSIMTATTTAAANQESGRWADEHPLHHQREGRHDHGHRADRAVTSCRSPGLLRVDERHGVPYRAAPHRCSEAYRTYVDEDRPADGDHEPVAGPGNGARPEGDEDRSVSVDLAALRRVSDGGRPERTIVDIDTWSFIALAAAALLAAAVFSIVSVADNVLTGIGVGVVVGVALAPVVSRVQRRMDTTRGSAVVLVGTGWR